jgi:GT2 family glycosyltransferase
MPTKIDLHLVTWNRPAMTKLVIEAIHRNTKPGTFRLHVFDNGSDKLMQKMLEAWKWDKKIDTLRLSKSNYGLETAREQLRLWNVETDAEYFVCIDSDCLPPPATSDYDWLEQLFRLMEANPEHAAISMRTQVMIGTGNIFEEADEKGLDLVDFPHPGGSFRIMRAPAVEQVGGWDEPKEGRGAEERFIGGKLNDAGFKTAFAAKVQCLHLFGLRGDNGTDQWGYDKDLKPADTGHSEISHPALTNGDDLAEVERYVGQELTDDYRNY